MVSLTSHRMNSVILLMLMLLQRTTIITAGSTVALVVAIHDGIGTTARTLIIIHNLRFVILELVEVCHTTSHAHDFLAASVVVALAILFPF